MRALHATSPKGLHRLPAGGPRAEGVALYCGGGSFEMGRAGAQEMAGRAALSAGPFKRLRARKSPQGL